MPDLILVDTPTKPKKTKRKYSDDDKASALSTLDATGGCLENAANIVGVPRNTLRRWAEGEGVNDNIQELRQIKDSQLSERLFELAEHIFRSMVGKIERASLKDAAIAGATVLDKSRLLASLPTSINENRDHLNPVAVAAYAKKRGISLELADAELTQTADEMGLTSELTQ